MIGYEAGKPFYQANIWLKNGKGDPLLLEEFTTKIEAVRCVKKFLKRHNGDYEYDCYIVHFDENECSDYSFDV